MSEVAKFYNERVEYMSQGNVRHSRIYEGLKMCRLGPNVEVLDLGVGTGLTSEYMARAGCNVLAVDFAEDLIAYGEEHRQNKNIEWLVHDITTLDVDRKFDLIVLADVIEHVEAERTLDLMKVIFDHSKPSTFVYVNVPYWPWQQFAHHYGIGDTAPIDNVFDLSTTLNLFGSINFLPMHTDIYGIGTPLEYIEIVLVRKEELWSRWQTHYGDIGVIEIDDGIND